MNKKSVTQSPLNPFTLGGTSPPNHNDCLNRSKSQGSDINSKKICENKIDEELLTKEGLAEKLKFSVSYINKLMRLGKIKATIKTGKSVRFQYSEVLAALKRESTV